VREVTREQHELMYTCVYCGKLITQFPCKGMDNGRRAHLECYIDHADEEKTTSAVQSSPSYRVSCMES